MGKVVKTGPNFLSVEKKLLDPPGQDRIGGHYLHAWCLTVRTFVRHKNKRAQKTK